MEKVKVKGRHELKYYINDSDHLQLKRRLPNIMKLDPNVGSDGAYRVRSLYFDNYHDKALSEKIDGVNEREKFRIRYYGDDLSNIHLEKKSKRNSICFKESEPISYQACQRLLQGDMSVLKDSGLPLQLELYIKMKSEQLRPQNIVDYWRNPFVYRAGNVRVTLDYNIRTSFDVQSFLHPNSIVIPIPNVVILEIKYDEFLPEIVRNIVAIPSRSVTAFSKYAMTRLV